MNKTDIEWTDLSANPIKYRRKSDGKTVWACVKCSPGCANCYSEAIALRFNRGKLFNAANMEEVEPYLDDAECRKMLAAKRVGGAEVSGARCFIGDMTDVFGEWVSDEILNRLFSSVLEIRRDVTWQILTKRAERASKYLQWRWGEGRIVPRNIHIGVSVEDQKRADERIPHLLNAPAAVRFLSCEPLLGPLNLMSLDGDCTGCTDPRSEGTHQCGTRQHPAFPDIQWIIVGGESGHSARPCELRWIRSIIAQCQAASVPVFAKQIGARIAIPNDSLSEWPRDGDVLTCLEPDDIQPMQGETWHYRLADVKGGDWSEWPADLKVRQFPEASA